MVRGRMVREMKKPPDRGRASTKRRVALHEEKESGVRHVLHTEHSRPIEHLPQAKDIGWLHPERSASTSLSDLTWRPSRSKLSGSSHVSKADLIRGHSSSTIAYQAVSRLRPL